MESADTSVTNVLRPLRRRLHHRRRPPWVVIPSTSSLAEARRPIWATVCSDELRECLPFISSTMQHQCEAGDPCVVGRLNAALPFWRDNLKASQFVLDIMQDGYTRFRLLPSRLHTTRLIICLHSVILIS